MVSDYLVPEPASEGKICFSLGSSFLQVQTLTHSVNCASFKTPEIRRSRVNFLQEKASNVVYICTRKGPNICTRKGLKRLLPQGKLTFKKRVVVHRVVSWHFGSAPTNCGSPHASWVQVTGKIAHAGVPRLVGISLLALDLCRRSSPNVRVSRVLNLNSI